MDILFNASMKPILQSDLQNQGFSERGCNVSLSTLMMANDGTCLKTGPSQHVGLHLAMEA